ncbi:acyltransferase family protein [Elizabethkingia ursingii]|nr:acyltransferase [Elizabethkingia ursingii]
MEILKSENAIPSMSRDLPFYPGGHIRVIFFLVLSSFLITYLLTGEKEKNGDINLRKFYIKRILRIWPLYYFIILLCYFLFGPDPNNITTILCLFMLPNVAYAFDINFLYSPQIWFIGASEQFYLLFPILFSVIPERRIILWLFLFYIGYTLFPHLLVRIYSNEQFGKTVFKIYYATQFNSMAMGCIAGYAFRKNLKWIGILKKNVFAFGSIILAVILWGLNFEEKYFNDEIFSTLFAIIIIGVAGNKNIKIGSKISTFLGKISYGIYLYHWIVMLIALKYIKYNENDNIIYYNFVLYSFVISSTIIVSWISHITIERYFLQLKTRIGTYINIIGKI